MGNSEQIAGLDRTGSRYEGKPLELVGSKIFVFHLQEYLGSCETGYKRVVGYPEGSDLRVQTDFIHKVMGGALFRGQDTFDLQPLENRAVESVDSAGVDVADAQFPENRHGLYAGAEILSDSYTRSTFFSGRAASDASSVESTI